MVFTEKFEETKEVIKSHILKKDIQYNSKKKRTDNTTAKRKGQKDTSNGRHDTT
jgi:hypothetical protein